MIKVYDTNEEIKMRYACIALRDGRWYDLSGWVTYAEAQSAYNRTWHTLYEEVKIILENS